MNKPSGSGLTHPMADDQVLADLGLIDGKSEQAFDNVTSLTTRLLGAQISMVSIVQEKKGRQLLKSHVGLPQEIVEAGETPISYSFCQYVRADDAPLLVSDAQLDPTLKNNLAVVDFGVISYLGMPIHLPDGTPIGALCAIDKVPRQWSADDQRTLQQLANIVDEQIASKVALREAEKATAKAQQRAQTRAAFLAHVAHEIRTPLNGIVGAVDLMQEKLSKSQEDEECQELINTVVTSTKGLERILNDTLDISKIDAGKLELEQLPFSPKQIIDEAVALYHPTAQKKKLSLGVNLTARCAERARIGDAFRFRQVLDNLLSNAIKFTDAGRVDVTLECQPETMVVKVTDTGCGMSAEQLENVFSPYTQADASVSRRKGGSGLGLSIVQKLVDLMSGTLSVSSAPNHGSEFTLTLPMPLAETGAQPVQRPTPPTNSQPFKGQRFLIADDSAATLLVLSKLLTSMGAVVHQCDNGQSALEALQRWQFHTVLLDINMPDINGTEVASAVTNGTVKTASDQRPLLAAMTGDVMPAQIQTYQDAGFVHCLAKPISRESLLTLAPAGTA